MAFDKSPLAQASGVWSERDTTTKVHFAQASGAGARVMYAGVLLVEYIGQVERTR